MNYEKYMKKCIKLALKAEGQTSPNPMVGCVVLDKNGKQIATGYHKKAGLPHAEAMALNKLGDEAIGGTLIVNLEPCSHYGKTPPCADLIIKKGIKKLVVGMQDPNPLVAGKGIQKCKDAGIEVIEDVLHEDVLKLNEVFIKDMTQKACFVAIKTATTLDGKIATKTGSSKWITSESARAEVQRIRNRYDAIITTSSTVIADNPSLTCRTNNNKKPIKIVLDRQLKTSYDSKIYASSGEKIYIVVDKNIEDPKINSIPTHVAIIKCKTHNCKVDMGSLFETLYDLGIKSVLVEAGGKLNGDIVSSGLLDKIYHFLAPKIIADDESIDAFYGRDIKEISNSLNFKFDAIADFKPDMLVTYYPS